MTGYNLPTGCEVSDLPGCSDREVERSIAWDNALLTADKNIKAGLFDSDDVTEAMHVLVNNMHDEFMDAIKRDDCVEIGELLTIELRRNIARALMEDD